MLTITLLVVSFAILVATFFIWRDTSSRPSLFNGIFASLALLIASHLVETHTNPDLAVSLPILAGMLVFGRGIGTWLRCRKEPELKSPATLWLCSGIACFVCATSVYYSITRA